MKNGLYILLIPLLVGSCLDKNDNKNQYEQFSNENIDDSNDSLVHYYEQTILDYYSESDTNEYKIPFEVTGKVEYVDDSILILTFNEILKFGSWHYTNSSLFFIKDGNQLIPISSNLSELRILSDDYYERDIQYPNRIHGKFKQRIDLTGDGEPEYIFHSKGSIRTGFEESYNFYRLNLSNNKLELMNLSIISNGIQGECDSTFGELREFKIIENDSINPIIEIKKTISSCNNNTITVEGLSPTFSYYVWNGEENKFIELLLTKPKLN